MTASAAVLVVPLVISLIFILAIVLALIVDFLEAALKRNVGKKEKGKMTEQQLITLLYWGIFISCSAFWGVVYWVFS